jgi:hypothetical protein
MIFGCLGMLKGVWYALHESYRYECIIMVYGCGWEVDGLWWEM